MVALRCYESKAAGIHCWLANQPAEYRVEIDAELELVQAAEDLEGLNSAKPLRGKCEGLTEIKIDFWAGDDEIHIRVLGYQTRSGEFILLWPFRKFGGPDYGPACRSAFTRKRGVERNGRRARPCRFP
jgi:hypothetical protein